jgi:hypothetical protein
MDQVYVTFEHRGRVECIFMMFAATKAFLLVVMFIIVSWSRLSVSSEH